MVTKNNNKISKLKADAYDLLKEEVSKLSGLKKSEILALKSELEAEQKAKKAKEKPYKQNKAVNKKPRLSNMEKMY